MEAVPDTARAPRNAAASTGLVLGPIAAAVLMIAFDLDPEEPGVTRAAAVAIWMAIWWITEAVPLAVTALLPVVLFPALSLMGAKEVAPLYCNNIILLFVGAFMVALAMQRWNLHKRIGLRNPQESHHISTPPAKDTSGRRNDSRAHRGAVGPSP